MLSASTPEKLKTRQSSTILDLCSRETDGNHVMIVTSSFSTRFVFKTFSVHTTALPTLIRFQTKTKLFCSVFKKTCVHTYRFRIVFAVHTITPIKREATWQNLSAILDTHGRLVWRSAVSILIMSPFSDSIVFSVHTRKQRFQKVSFSALQCGQQPYPEQNSSVFV